MTKIQINSCEWRAKLKAKPSQCPRLTYQMVSGNAVMDCRVRVRVRVRVRG
jgi:hypothetical protein